MKFTPDYEELGAHLIHDKSQTGVRFSVWAPHALKVSVVGYFNDWNGNSNSMKKNAKTGEWSLYISGLSEGTIYKYEIITQHGKKLHKSDPFAFYTGVSPDFSCRVVDLSRYKWEDLSWQEAKAKHHKWNQPISIYELHLGSWCRHRGGKHYSYLDFVDTLIDYVKCLGYTHIELMPVMEHPFEGSWGYQCTGYFSPNSRFGTPEEFMCFVDCCHQAGIGVILDWVPSHFCKDMHGLAWFDGAPCYEYNAYNRSIRNRWGCNNFALGRSNVQNFLISSALFWLDKYHIDGFRVDSVADILNNIRGKNVGSRFLRKLNDTIDRNFPGTIMIAEDSSIREGITDGGINGIGFTYCWNMGWTNDILKYMKHKPEDRKNHHRQLTFTLEYAHRQNFVLAFSHDEMALGRGSLMEKMPGNVSEKLKNLKLMLAWQFVHPGKKLMFMGTEIAQKESWHFNKQLSWKRLKYKKYKEFHKFIRQLNKLYCNEPAMWQLDRGEKETVLQFSDSENSIVILRRYGWNSKNFVIIIANFSNKDFDNYWIGVPEFGKYQIIFSTEDDFIESRLFFTDIKAEHYNWQNLPARINLKIPGLSLQVIHMKIY